MDAATRRKVVGGNGPGDRLTPRWLYAALDRRFQFTYDPAADHGNRLVGALAQHPMYSTTEGTWGLHRDPKTYRWRRRKHGDDDGLTNTWEHQRVFVNPPYSRGEINRWVAKMANERERARIIVALLPARTSEVWWHRHVLPYCDITYFYGRLRFEGMEHAAPFPSVLAVYRNALMDGIRQVT